MQVELLRSPIPAEMAEPIDPSSHRASDNPPTQSADTLSVPAALFRRYVLEQLDEAALALRMPPRSRHKGMHRARKALQRARAALGLAQTSLGRKAVALERTLQRLRAKLSGVRDAHARVETLAKVRSRAGEAELGEAFAHMQRILVAQRRAALRAFSAIDPGFDTFLAELSQVRAAATELAWHKLRAAAVARELARTDRRILAAGEKARGRNDEARRHRWRRRLRRGKGQNEMLEWLLGQASTATSTQIRTFVATVRAGVAPSGPSPEHHIDAAHELGAEHDLRILRRAIKHAAALPAAQRKQLRDLLRDALRALRAAVDA